MTLTEDELDVRMRAADPARDIRPTAAALDGLAVSTRRASRAGRRRWWAILSGALVLILSGGVIAAPAIAGAVRDFFAQTGQHGPVSGETDDSEWITPAAEDFIDYTATIYPTWMPLPDGVDATAFRTAIALRLATAADDPSTLMQSSGITTEFEIGGYCLWLGQWLDARQSGASPERALAVLQEATAWPELVAHIVDFGGENGYGQELVDAARSDDVNGLWETPAAHLCMAPWSLHFEEGAQ